MPDTTSMTNTTKHSPSEEFANCLTHGAGLMLAIVGAGILCFVAAGNANGPLRWSCFVYALALVALYGASTLSHLFESPERRRFFRCLDQGIIFLFIAGTFTPLAIVYLSGVVRWALLAATWAAAIVGFYSKVFRAHRVESTAITHYLALGWLPAMAIVPILRSLPTTEMAWFVAGGLCYTVGTVFLTLDRKIPYFHAMWHLLVIAGSFCHFLVIFFCASSLAV